MPIYSTGWMLHLLNSTGSIKKEKWLQVLKLMSSNLWRACWIFQQCLLYTPLEFMDYPEIVYTGMCESATVSHPLFHLTCTCTCELQPYCTAYWTHYFRRADNLLFIKTGRKYTSITYTCTFKRQKANFKRPLHRSIRMSACLANAFISWDNL